MRGAEKYSFASRIRVFPKEISLAGIWDTKSRVSEKRAKELLKGAVDFHIHTGPDIYPRLVNDIEVANQAKRAGMRAVLIKSHATVTADRAQIARAVTGFPVFGGVALNWYVGGLNKYAVECAAKLGARQVWMPTTHAANYLKYVDHVPMFAKAMPKDVKGISLFQGNGGLLPELTSILEVIAKNAMILATGHLSPAEGIALIREAKKAGVAKIVVTHPAATFTSYSVAQMREALDAGANFLEHVFNDCTPQVADPIPASALGDAIKAIGPEHCIMSTASGKGDDAVHPGNAGLWIFRGGDPENDGGKSGGNFGDINCGPPFSVLPRLSGRFF